MKPIEKHRMLHYRDRAESFFRAMQLAADRALLGDEAPQYADAAALLAVHSAISLADAVLVGCTGRRGNDEDHRVASVALRALCVGRHALADGVDHLTWLLARKSDLAYNEKRLSGEDLDRAVLKAERFAAWAYRTFPELARQERIP